MIVVTITWLACSSPGKQHRITAKQRMSRQPNALSLKPISIKLQLDRCLGVDWLVIPFPSQCGDVPIFPVGKLRMLRSSKWSFSVLFNKGKALTNSWMYESRSPCCDNSFTLVFTVLNCYIRLLTHLRSTSFLLLECNYTQIMYCKSFFK